MKDYYKILGIEKNASPEEIKRAYRSEAKKYHPDTTEFDKEYAARQIIAIREAYETLSDPAAKATYDENLAYRTRQKTGRQRRAEEQWREEAQRREEEQRRTEAQRRAEEQRRTEAQRREEEQNRKETYNEHEENVEEGGIAREEHGTLVYILGMIGIFVIFFTATNIGGTLETKFHWHPLMAFVGGAASFVAMIKIAIIVLSRILR